MKTYLLTLWLVALGSLKASADDVAWLTSLPQAAQIAATEHKTILLDFTGSDWCGWCKKLDAETFSTLAFAEYARQRLVLVRVDFPRQTPLPADLAQANHELGEKYNVHGYPTLIDLAPDGTVLWKQVGYLAGGPATLIAQLDKVSSKPAAEPNFAKAIFPAPPPRQPGDEPKLQAILFSRHPTVTLDGKICEEGDTVHGMRVIKISRDKVTVAWKGQTKDLAVK